MINTYNIPRDFVFSDFFICQLPSTQLLVGTVLEYLCYESLASECFGNLHRTLDRDGSD